MNPKPVDQSCRKASVAAAYAYAAATDAFYFVFTDAFHGSGRQLK